ncbi:glycosyltransferase [Kineosporia sp. R_H_3]|uniref:glycosyltransferase n=1 Tax=Kineosporia sp. R_H_3 TaxID=1961848 RepID=UPI0018E91095|nr:glycosyltransferase [Kineosporia sp. R_H_3]
MTTGTHAGFSGAPGRRDAPTLPDGVRIPAPAGHATALHEGRLSVDVVAPSPTSDLSLRTSSTSTSTTASPTGAHVDLGRMVVLNEWFESIGGAERTLLAMLDAFPGAEGYALWKDAGAQAPAHLRESWLARTPLRGRKALTLPLMPFVWRTQTRRRYDVVLSLSHSLNHTARFPLNPGGAHLSYVHTPARYVHLPEIDRRRRAGLQSLAVGVTKQIERRTSRHVDSYAANSVEVQQRIREFWGRDARVVNPPVRTGFFTPDDAPTPVCDRGYLLGVGRWILYKRFDTMIDVAARSGLPLVLAGAGPMEGELRERAAASGVPVAFEVRPTDERVRELMRGAKALLFPCHEDFGIVPVEAQACGTPVVGLGRGGLAETVVDGRTGALVDEIDVTALADAVRRVDRLDPLDMRANALRFGSDRFAAQVQQWVHDVQAGDRF